MGLPPKAKKLELVHLDLYGPTLVFLSGWFYGLWYFHWRLNQEGLGLFL